MSYLNNQASILNWLQDWASNQCNDYWEHLSAVSITMLDNPGWNVRIELEGTVFEGLNQALQMHHVSEDDWFGFKVELNSFQGFGDLKKLEVILGEFRQIVEKHGYSSS